MNVVFTSKFDPGFKIYWLTCLYLAGGQAVNSRMERMLTVVPEHIHDRSGIFMGSYDEVQQVIDVHKKHIK